MKISCPACSAKYSIADEKVQDRLAKIRCRKCGSTIVIDGKANPPQVTTAAGEGGEAHALADAAVTSSGTEYSVDFGEGDQRNMAVSELVEAYNAGQVTTETYVWAEGFADWKPLGEVQEIADALRSGTAAARPAPTPAAPSASALFGAAASQPSPSRAASRSTRGRAADLFGSIDSAGSEDDVATSAPDQGSSSLGGGSGTGARNESSVLFSLSALTSAAGSKPKTSTSGASPARSATSAASRDDSGLIDLKALTAAAVNPAGTPAAPPLGGAPVISPLAAAPLAVAPLGLGSPLGGGVATGIELEAPQKNKTGLYVGLAIVAAAVIVSVAFILRPAPPPPVIAAPAPIPAPTPTPTPTPTPEIAATPPATGSPEEEAAPDAGTKKVSAAKRYPRSNTGTSTKAPSGGGETKAPATEAPKPAKSKCGCAPGDLQCAMRCAAKGG